MSKYNLELDGQLDFYNTYLPRVDKSKSIDDILINNTDGILNGNILEFKLTINDVNSVLFQAIKYLSAMRVKGQSIPANILLVSLNTSTVFQFHSQDYLKQIETLYNAGASKDNVGFRCDKPVKTFNLEDSSDVEEFIKVLKSDDFTKINIDENCIVGWAERFYRKNPLAKKSDFIGDNSGKVKIIGEIRKPKEFKDLINPYTGKDNIKFRYLMDKLNDTLTQKNLGAFYTPELYAQKSLELLRKAIERVPEGYDYIILDRCAGTGNLEQYLTDEELSHTIVSTIEYYEYKVLSELLGDKVRHIIPPIENEDTFNAGLVRGADALSEEYVNNPIIKKYIDNPKCTVILFENPPYAEVNGTSIGTGSKAVWKQSFVVQEMKKEVNGVASNDLSNAFIWSAFKYYLRQPTDSYIVFSPIKYWKAQHLISKKFLDGFAFNRKHFHTNIEACISCILWPNEDDLELESFNIQAYNIVNNELKHEKNLPISKVHTMFSKVYYDKRKFDNDLSNGILSELNGLDAYNRKSVRAKPIFNDNIIGYLAVPQTGFDNPDLCSILLIAASYNGNGFFLRKDNFMEKLPMFAASRYITYNREWTERTRIMKSADGHKEYFKALEDNDGYVKSILQKVLLFTCFETQNHMRSLVGSDGRFYRNELCLDTTNGETIASVNLKDFKPNSKEQAMLDTWNLILERAKTTKNYNPEYTYGVYQIIDELNTFYKDENGKTIYEYPQLNGHLKALKQLVKEYYNEEIVPFLLKFQFIK